MMMKASAWEKNDLPRLEASSLPETDQIAKVTVVLLMIVSKRESSAPLLKS